MDSRFYGRAFALACVALLGFLLWRILSPFFSPLAWSALLAFLAQPLERKITARFRKPRVTALLLTACAALLVLTPLFFFTLAFAQQASDLLKRVQAEVSSRHLPALDLFLQLTPVSRALDWISQFASVSKEQIAEQVSDGLQGILSQVASVGGTLVLGIVNVATQSVMTLFLFFFLVRDGREMVGLGVRLVPMSGKRKDELVKHLGGVARAVVLGTTVTALVQGTLVGIGFTVSGLPSPLVFGALASVAALVPLVGTGLIWVPAVITLFAQGRTGWGIFLLLWSGILVTGADNVLRPLIISGQSKISTLLIILGVLGGVPLFGVSGLFLGPLLLTLVSALLRFADETRLSDDKDIHLVHPS